VRLLGRGRTRSGVTVMKGAVLTAAQKRATAAFVVSKRPSLSLRETLLSVGARAHPQRGDGDEGRRVDGGAEAGHGGVRGVRGGVEQRRQRPDHLGGEPLPQAGMSDFAATGFNSKATWFGI
jgi:hypothetical protein